MWILDNNILEVKDIQNINPSFSLIKELDRKDSQESQTILFSKNTNTLSFISTNNHTEKLNEILKKYQNKWFQTQVYYTSVDWFNEASKRYDKLEEFENQKKENQKQQEQAEWISAIEEIKKIYEKRDAIDPSKFITKVIRLSFQTGASDLHFQSTKDDVLLRLRIDGILQNILKFSIEEFQKYNQKIKFMSGVKMNVSVVPQDGRFSFTAKDSQWKERDVDARVSMFPWLHNESIVIRFLESLEKVMTFQDIGFTWENYKKLTEWLKRKWGISIFSGPTGSGKTTTLYSILANMNTGKEKIITLEDPIEYQMKWIQQSQIAPDKWYTFEEWLKAVLRHDPDIILVWETRNKETADISINAALTWHTVFTTLHTKGAIQGITRLENMWVESYMLSPSLNMIVAQRLVRRLCPYCSAKIEASYGDGAIIKEMIQNIKNRNPNTEIKYDGYVSKSQGCEVCNHTWYKWRMAIVEVLLISPAIKKAIIDKKSIEDIVLLAKSEWFTSLQEDAILKVIEWLTDMDELRRVL